MAAAAAATASDPAPLASSGRAARRELQDRQRACKAARAMGTDASTSTLFWLIRHGETDWNLERRLQGQSQPGPPLNPPGREQALALAEHLAALAQGPSPGGRRCAGICSSDLLRAVQTAEVLAQRLQLPVTQHPALRERNLGVLTGLTAAAAPELQPGAWAQLQGPDRGARIDGGGESRNDLQRRVEQAVQGLADEHAGCLVLLVTHGGFLQALHEAVRGYSSRTKVLNCSLSVLQVPVSTARGTRAGAAAAGAAAGSGRAAEAGGTSQGRQADADEEEEEEEEEAGRCRHRQGQQRHSAAAGWALLEWNGAEHLGAGLAAAAAFGGGARDG